MKISEILKLWLLNLAVAKRSAVEYAKVVFRYYRNPLFRKADLSLLLQYLFKSPFRISKAFMQGRGAHNIYVYGETPLTTLDKIARECGISKNDTVFELGCGRGRTCFWLACFFGCQAVGIEYIPEFIQKALFVKERCNIANVEFLQEDILEADFSAATVIYLYGSNFGDTFLKKLIKKMKSLKEGTKIITVSYPLNDYAQGHLFETQKRFPASFTWGEADVYFQVINPTCDL
jgi:SAM-dependent methyltransferase